MLRGFFTLLNLFATTVCKMHEYHETMQYLIIQRLIVNQPKIELNACSEVNGTQVTMLRLELA